MTANKVYRFCSVCRKQLTVYHDDGDVLSARCPDGHENIFTYQSWEAMRKYALNLFRCDPQAREN
jgi:hypothetical protein